MRILLINHFPLTGSGSGVYTENIARSLKKYGHDVCIIFPDNQKTEKYEFKTHPVYFNTEKIPFNFPCFTTHPRSTQTFYNLTKKELNIYINSFKEAIEEEIKTFKPDIIHVGHIWILADIAANYNIPIVITAHGTDIIGFTKSEKLKEYGISAAQKTKAIIAISNENRQNVEKSYPFVKNKTIIIPNGYNQDVFYKENFPKKAVLEEIGITKNYQKIVSFAGKFTKIKGIDVLLKAAQIYQNEDTLTILSGDGELFKEMISLSKKLNLKNIKFLGNQPHKTLNKIYNISDIAIVPSREESFGLVVIEAMATGTPVIGTKIGGIKDIINNKNGIFIEKDDDKDLAKNIIDVLSKKTTFDSEKIAEMAKENYSQDKFTKELIKIYKNIIKNAC